MDGPPGATKAAEAYDGARLRRAAPARSPATPDASRARSRKTRAGSSARGHAGGQDVVRVAVQIVACPVIPHRGARVAVAGGNLDIAQVDASNCRWVNPRAGDSAGTEGRRTCSAGECSRTPSRTQVR